MLGLSQTLVAGCVCWLLTSSLWIYPHSLSYFNESIGGPLNGPKHVLGSNVDWGQDLRYVKRWLHGHSDDSFHLAYYGCAGPTNLGVVYSDIRIPVEDVPTLKQLDEGWYAVSATLLGGYPWLVANATGSGKNYFDRESLTAFRELPAQFNLAYSIRVYRIGSRGRSFVR